ncbi:MAG TPA: hypothetical protein VD816_00620 [Ohtaekwangia sp.]|nr:hypothetical protein [Ohtaekwangia sp.]
MRKAGLILFFAGCLAISASAQDQTRTDNYPYWTISKGVQQHQFRDVKFIPAKITSADQTHLISKGVHQLQAARQPKRTGTVALGGDTSWTISKGVARYQAERK